MNAQPDYRQDVVQPRMDTDGHGYQTLAPVGCVTPCALLLTRPTTVPVPRWFETAIFRKVKAKFVSHPCLSVSIRGLWMLHPDSTAKVRLKTTRLPLGLLINFNVPVLKNGIQRVVYTNDRIALTPGEPVENELGVLGALA